MFFAGDSPPNGLRNPYNKAIKYICQPDDEQTFYSTMFDEEQGIAVVAAYSLRPGDVAFQKRKTFTWTPTLGKYLHLYWNKMPFWLSVTLFLDWGIKWHIYPPTMPARYQLQLPLIPLPLELNNNSVWWFGSQFKIVTQKLPNNTSTEIYKITEIFRYKNLSTKGFVGNAKLRVIRFWY